MEKRNFESIENEDPELSAFDKRELYEILSNKIWPLFDEKLFGYKANFVGIMRLGEETENNIEVSALFLYHPGSSTKEEYHELNEITITVNQVEHCYADYASHSVLASTLFLNDNSLAYYMTDYYLYDNETATCMRVYLDDYPELYKNQKISKKLLGLNKDCDEGRATLTASKLQQLMAIIENLLPEHKNENNGLKFNDEDQDGEDEGTLYD